MENRKTGSLIVRVTVRQHILFSITLLICLLACREQPALPAPYPIEVTAELLMLENDYKQMLEPINNMKDENPSLYWFIVSWLNTNYKTPDWKGYGTKAWKEKTKKRGIDCSGFARVMQKELFNRKIRGSSKEILNNHCTTRRSDQLKLGDLVFFASSGSGNPRISHVGVYLENNYFVHATSRKSAAKGLGLNINSLQEKRWILL